MVSRIRAYRKVLSLFMRLANFYPHQNIPIFRRRSLRTNAIHEIQTSAVLGVHVRTNARLRRNKLMRGTYRQHDVSVLDFTLQTRLRFGVAQDVAHQLVRHQTAIEDILRRQTEIQQKPAKIRNGFLHGLIVFDFEFHALYQPL